MPHPLVNEFASKIEKSRDTNSNSEAVADMLAFCSDYLRNANGAKQATAAFMKDEIAKKKRDAIEKFSQACDRVAEQNRDRAKKTLEGQGWKAVITEKDGSAKMFHKDKPGFHVMLRKNAYSILKNNEPWLKDRMYEGFYRVLDDSKNWK